jgi:hypothetical protein
MFIREWVKSSLQATRLAELVSITPGWNDPQITCLDDEVMDAIDALPDGPDDFQRRRRRRRYPISATWLVRWSLRLGPPSYAPGERTTQREPYQEQ